MGGALKHDGRTEGAAAAGSQPADHLVLHDPAGKLPFQGVTLLPGGAQITLARHRGYRRWWIEPPHLWTEPPWHAVSRAKTVSKQWCGGQGVSERWFLGLVFSFQIANSSVYEKQYIRKTTACVSLLVSFQSHCSTTLLDVFFERKHV